MLLRSWLGPSFLLVLALGCEERTSARSEGRQPALVQNAPPAPEVAPTDECALRKVALEREPALPGAPTFEAARVEILGRARSVPVVFERAPLPTAGAGAEIDAIRKELVASADPADSIFQVLKRTRHRFAERRAIFLSEGYLYAESPHLALRLSQVLRLDHLFDEPTLVVDRGGQRLVAHRHRGKYFWDDGGSAAPSSPVPSSAAPSSAAPSSATVEPRREANLILLDRVRSQDEPPRPPLHLDFTSLREQLAFDRIAIERITHRGWIVRLQTADVDSVALVHADQGEARLTCEMIAESDRPRLTAARMAQLRHAELLRPIMAAAHDIVERRLPFDEPRTEDGQQDGHLRIAFRKAYESYQHTYEFNGDRYFVFDGFGRPLLPEVCIDFITDAIEWGTGGRWAQRGERREHVRGAIDFKSFGLENARSIEQVAEFGADHPEWFDLGFVPPEQRVKFVHRARFFEQIAQRPNFYRVGDVVFILGLRDDDLFHYHSFFVDAVDPLTGAPVLLVSNAGPPQVRTWEGEMHNAPLRSVSARLRLRAELLEAAREKARSEPGVPLAPRPLAEVELHDPVLPLASPDP